MRILTHKTVVSGANRKIKNDCVVGQAGNEEMKMCKNTHKKLPAWVRYRVLLRIDHVDFKLQLLDSF
jgi:hypothetical protein